MTERDRCLYDAWTRQLERMRAMQYAYNRKFFVLLLVSSAAVACAFHLGSLPLLALVGPGLVTTGMTASFFLHQCDFARVHAQAMEQRINRLLGGRVLIASELEAEYFYPHAVPKLSGVTWGRPWTLFNWFTLHFTVSWAALTAWALWLLHARWESPVLVAYLVALGSWAASNVWVLARWFGTARAERRMQDQLRADDGLTPGGN
jgi:hypothetical protein